MTSPTHSVPSGDAAWRYQRADADTSWSTPRSVGVWTKCVSPSNGRRISFTNGQFLGGYSEGELFVEEITGEPDNQFLLPVTDQWVCVGYVYDGSDTRWYYAYEGDTSATLFATFEGHAYWNWLTIGGGEFANDARGTLFSVAWDYSVNLGAAGWIEQARTSSPIVDEEDSRFFTRNQDPGTANQNLWGTDPDWTLTGTIGAAVADAPTFPGDAAPTHDLTAGSIETGAPTLGTPALAQRHALTTSAVAAGAPVLGSPTLRQRHALGAFSLAAGAPTLGAPSLAVSGPHELVAVGLSTGAPRLGTPALNLT
ncbi:MAG TPA: hypothetical protein VLC09_09220, partial [Polyangiaceae bacterium]|nr:hypothetical protein [Polyangiaceae bacterium]